MHKAFFWLAAAIALGPFAAAQAQTYPNRAIRLVGPFPPGGSNDLIARIVAGKLDESLGQRVVVDNRPGGNGVIGTQIVARAAPDGYTILWVPAVHAINAALQSNLPYDSIRDFSPVTNIASAPNVLVVHPSVPARSVRDLIRLAKTRPGYSIETWFGIFLPAGTPGEVVARLQTEIVRIIRLPDVRELLSAQGADVIGSTPEEFAAYVKSEIEKWKRVIKAAGVRPE